MKEDSGIITGENKKQKKNPKPSTLLTVNGKTFEMGDPQIVILVLFSS